MAQNYKIKGKTIISNLTFFNDGVLFCNVIKTFIKCVMNTIKEFESVSILTFNKKEMSIYTR